MREEIICAGFGGQGIMSLGKFIAQTAIRKGLGVTWMPSYGAEVRGGTAHCMVIVSDKEIASPLLSFCDTAIVMNQPSVKRFFDRVKSGGTLLLNSSLASPTTERKDISVIEVPMTDIAIRLGNVRVANVVALGAYMNLKEFLLKDVVIDGIRDAFSRNPELVELNVKALEEGLKIR